MPQESVDIVRRCLACFAARDFDGVAGLMDPDVVWQPASLVLAPDAHPGAAYHGREGVRQWGRDIQAMIGYTVQPVDFTSAGEHVLVTAIPTVTWWEANGVRTHAPRIVFYVFTLLDERVVSLQTHLDESEARAAAGL